MKWVTLVRFQNGNTSIISAAWNAKQDKTAASNNNNLKENKDILFMYLLIDKSPHRSDLLF